MSCKYHRFIDVNPATGTIIYNIGRTTVKAPTKRGRTRPKNLTRKAPVLPMKAGSFRFGEATDQVMEAFDRAAEEDEPTCVLDMIGEGESHTLEDTGDFFSLTRERMRQIEVKAIMKAREVYGDDPEMKAWEEDSDRRPWDWRGKTSD